MPISGFVYRLRDELKKDKAFREAGITVLAGYAGGMAVYWSNSGIGNLEQFVAMFLLYVVVATGIASYYAIFPQQRDKEKNEIRPSIADWRYN